MDDNLTTSQGTLMQEKHSFVHVRLCAEVCLQKDPRIPFKAELCCENLWQPLCFYCQNQISCKLWNLDNIVCPLASGRPFKNCRSAGVILSDLLTENTNILLNYSCFRLLISARAATSTCGCTPTSRAGSTGRRRWSSGPSTGCPSTCGH